MPSRPHLPFLLLLPSPRTQLSSQQLHIVLLQVTLTKLPSLPPQFEQTKTAQKELLLASESHAAREKMQDCMVGL